jgi:hypothetical protein
MTMTITITIRQGGKERMKHLTERVDIRANSIFEVPLGRRRRRSLR